LSQQAGTALRCGNPRLRLDLNASGQRSLCKKCRVKDLGDEPME